MSESMKEFFEETMQMSSSKLAMAIMNGIMGESVEEAQKGGDLTKEIWCRAGALLDSFIETIKISRNKGNFDDLVGFLGAMRFRYCGNDTKKGNEGNGKSLN